MWTRVAVAFAVGFLLAVTTFYEPVCSEPYKHHDTQNRNNAQERPEQGFWCRTYMNAEAFWGFVGVLVGFVGVVYVARQIRQGNAAIVTAENAAAQASRDAQAATEETKRSVDAYIESERGNVGLYSIRLEPNGPLIDFSFLNAGRVPVKTSNPELGHVLIHKDAEFGAPKFAFQKDPGPLVHLVAVGEEFRTWDVPPDKARRLAAYSLSDITQAGWEAIKEGNAILHFCAYMDYQTTGGVWRTVSVHIFDPVEFRFYPAPSNDLTFDIKVYNTPIA